MFLGISIIIPAFNEEHYLPITLDTLNKNRFWDEIIIIDDGSTDKTASVPLPIGARLIKHEKNSGKGQAIFTGIQNCRGEYLVFLDADLGDTAYLAEKLIEPVKLGNADMAIAKFPPINKAGGFGIVKRFAKIGIKRLTGMELNEPLSGQRCIRKEILSINTNYNVGFGFEVALTLDVLRAGYSIYEIELPFRHRELGRTWRGFYHRGRELIHILRTFWRKR